jgi:hypothetical protein
MHKHEFLLYSRTQTAIQWLATFYLHGTRSEMSCRNGNGKHEARERVELARRWLIKHDITDDTCSHIVFIVDGICREAARTTAG